jgi:hypothetical protein
VLCVMERKNLRSIFFLHCEVASLVWSKVMSWLDCHFLTPPNLFVHWECWNRRGSNNNRKRGWRLIWSTTIWVLWKSRNDKNFNEFNFVVNDLVKEIKVLTWRWVLHRINVPVCLFYEWCWDPASCLDRVRKPA